MGKRVKKNRIKNPQKNTNKSKYVGARNGGMNVNKDDSKIEVTFLRKISNVTLFNKM